MDTIQNALKALFYSLGGNAADVADVNDVNAIILKIAALPLLAEIKAAAELPALPDDDGTYALQLVMDDGAAAMTWEAAEAAGEE